MILNEANTHGHNTLTQTQMTATEKRDTADPDLRVAGRSDTHWIVLLSTLITSTLSSNPTIFICTVIKCRFAVIKKTGQKVITNMNESVI